MTELLLGRAREAAPGVPERETSLLIVGHGTDLNEHSAVAAKREAEAIRRLHLYAAVLNVYMEEPPLVADWMSLTKTRNVVVVPFFISDGLHSYEDIPGLLGIASGPTESAPRRQAAGEVFRQNPYHLQGRELYYASSIGTDPRFAAIIVEQTEAFDCNETSHLGAFAGGLVA
jgi:sirohydrochlorin cobaltochelatase